MAHLPGTSPENPEGHAVPPSKFERLVGFSVLCGLGLGILAAVVLIPVCARVRTAEYQFASLEAEIADAKSMVVANNRLMEAIPVDDVLVKRFARTQSQWIPFDEAISISTNPDRPAVRTQIISITPHRRPVKPDGWIMRVGQKLEAPSKRRGLLLLGGIAMLVGTFLFAPPRAV